MYAHIHAYIYPDYGNVCLNAYTCYIYPDYGNVCGYTCYIYPDYGNVCA